MFAAFLGSALLIGSAVCICMHLRAWHEMGQDTTDSEDRLFYVRQFRRRVQASGMMGLIGFAIYFSPWVNDYKTRLFWFYWIALTLAVFWLAILAIADMVSLRSRLVRLTRRELEQQTLALRDQLLQRQRHKGNGDA